MANVRLVCAFGLGALLTLAVGTRGDAVGVQEGESAKATIGSISGLMHFQVGNVPKGSPADLGGLREGDLIREINGARMTSLKHMDALIEAITPGETVELTCLRSRPTCEGWDMVTIRITTEPYSENAGDTSD